ncbi:hypothetical protein [Mucilaginibacter aquatilis]|uniref:Lipoprotein n=1 Tax=Mucilaginibacter aquatilis TaxID=1517760 RepID=A0A6I4IAE6_9SPHI|nr:hypothetical protein [Mucilaginibacter aquatilis]MVN90486.1 hypothetical protein [Mucilaginibacter aquatilis]
MRHSFIFTLTIIAGILVSVSSCIKEADEPVIGCEPRPQLVLPLNIVDAATSENLFFSATPRYQVKDLYFFRKADVNRKDTIRPTVYGNANVKVFLVPLKIQSTGDTLIMKTGNHADDAIIYSVKNVNGDCPYTTLYNVLYNGSELAASGSGYIIKR